MSNQKGVILVIVIIFIVVLCMIAGISVILMFNQAVITESTIGRTKAFYTGQATMVTAISNPNGFFASSITPTLILNNRTATARRLTANQVDPLDSSFTCNRFSANSSITCLRIDVEY